MSNEIKVKLNSLHSSGVDDIICKMLDDYLLFDFKQAVVDEWCCGTYLVHYVDNTWSIRFPGATRGHIELNERNEILEVKLYDDECFGVIGVYNVLYKNEIADKLNDLIGVEMKFELESLMDVESEGD